MRRYALRDDQGDRIEALPPGRGGHVGVTAKDNRLFVEAVLHRHRAGVPWRDLPGRFGPWKKVHTRLGRWTKGGVWERIFRHLAGEADNEYAMIDSTIVRAHQHSAGAKGGISRPRRSAGARAARRPRSTPRSTRRATRPGSRSRPDRRTTSKAPMRCCLGSGPTR